MTENRENVNNAAAVDGGVNNETLADIVAEMRGMGNYQQYSGDHARALADRIEAAWRRERVRLMAEPRSWEDCVVEYQKKKEAGEYGPY